MTYAEINKKFTETVTEYITKGYTVNTRSMSGSQGEVAHIDFTNGVEVIRIILDNFHEWMDDEFCFGALDGLELIVGRVPNSADVLSARRCTIWNNELEVLSRERFYEVARNHRTDEKLYGTLEEAKANEEKRYSRRRARYLSKRPKTMTPSAKLIRQLKSRKGFSNATKNNIIVTREPENGGYGVSLRAGDGHITRTETIRFPKH